MNIQHVSPTEAINFIKEWSGELHLNMVGIGEHIPIHKLLVEPIIRSSDEDGVRWFLYYLNVGSNATLLISGVLPKYIRGATRRN